ASGFAQERPNGRGSQAPGGNAPGEDTKGEGTQARVPAAISRPPRARISARTTPLQLVACTSGLDEGRVLRPRGGRGEAPGKRLRPKVRGKDGGPGSVSAPPAPAAPAAAAAAAAERPFLGLAHHDSPAVQHRAGPPPGKVPGAAAGVC